MKLRFVPLAAICVLVACSGGDMTPPASIAANAPGGAPLAALYNLTAIPMAAMGLVSPLVAAATMAGSSLLVTLNALRLVRP